MQTIYDPGKRWIIIIFIVLLDVCFADVLESFSRRSYTDVFFTISVTGQSRFVDVFDIIVEEVIENVNGVVWFRFDLLEICDVKSIILSYVADIDLRKNKQP